MLEQAIRRVQVRVEWKEGKRTQHVAVVGYFTDPRKVDMAASGRLPTSGAGQLPSGAKAPSTGPTSIFRTSPSGSSSGGTKR